MTQQGDAPENDAARLQGLARALIASMVKGAAEGYTKTLEIQGVGYRAQMKQGVTPEGSWYEGAWGYHFYTLRGTWPLTEAARNCGVDLYDSPIQAMFDAPIRLISGRPPAVLGSRGGSPRRRRSGRSPRRTSGTGPSSRSRSRDHLHRVHLPDEHEERGDHGRTEIIVPNAAHGTNPATAVMCGYKVREIPTDDQGDVDLVALRAAVGPQTAGIMLTNPSSFYLRVRLIQRILPVKRSFARSFTLQSKTTSAAR